MRGETLGLVNDENAVHHARSIARHPLSMVDGGRDLLLEDGLQRLEIALRAAAGGVLVTSTAELLGDRIDVDVALRAHAHAPVARADLLEEDHREDLFHREGKVDEALSILIGATAVMRQLLI